MIVQVVNKSDFPLPQYETKGSAGMDVRADLKRYAIENNVISKSTFSSIGLKMEPFKVYVIPTGIFIGLPEGSQDVGYEAQIRPRSGLAAKYGITILNSPGTLDSDYRGELKIILMCLTEDGYHIKHGDRIAQIVIAQYLKAEWSPVSELDETVRGTGGFGHTGK
jgi:dUTP pyrophosphatase